MELDWRFLLTAGGVSAVVSAVVSILGTTLTLRVQKRKDAFEKFFPGLQQMRKALLDLPLPKLGRQSLTRIQLEGQLQGREEDWLLEELERVNSYFAACERIYAENEFLLAPEIQSRLRQEIHAIYDAQESFLKLIREKPGENIPAPVIIEEAGKKVLFGSNLLEAVDQQLKQLAAHYHR